MESGVRGQLFLMERRRSHGFSSRNLRQVSNVAPPHASMAQYPTWSIFGRMGSMSPMGMRVAHRDCCPSRIVVSMIFKGFTRHTPNRARGPTEAAGVRCQNEPYESEV